MGRRLLWIALLLTVAAALWPVAEDETGGESDMVERSPTPRGRAAVRKARPDQALRPLTQARSERDAEIADLFPGQSFAAPAVSAAPAEPVAPPLPFTYGGRYTEGSKEIVFLKEGEKMHKVRLGDTINATYRVENISTDAITLSFLPLGQQQTLQTGSPAPR